MDMAWISGLQSSLNVTLVQVATTKTHNDGFYIDIVVSWLV